MEENYIENKTEIIEITSNNPKNKDSSQIAGAIIVAGLIIAGAILLKGNSMPTEPGSKKLVTNAKVFNQCLDSGKYEKAVADSKAEGVNTGVNGTPKGFILRDGQVINTIDGAEPLGIVTQKIDAVLAGSGKAMENIKLAPVSSSDFILDGGSGAKVVVVMYEDFQCPFCEKFFKETEKTLIDNYIKSGKINFVYRDFAFLGPESLRAAEAARCAGEQGKFWEYHDYLYNHQNGENQGNFGDLYLKSFASELKLK